MDWKYLVDKVTHTVQLPSFLTMSIELMIGALRRGQTGNEILAILDALTSNDDNTNNETVTDQPTLEPIVF